MLQIRRSKRDNLEIIFQIISLKIMLRLSLEPSYQDGSNEGHNIHFHSEMRKIIFELSSLQHLFLSGALVQFAQTSFL